MFYDPSTTSFLVAERQARYRHEARQHRLARLSRRGRRASALSLERAEPSAHIEALPTAPTSTDDGLAA